MNYPISIKFNQSISDATTAINNVVLETCDAITVEININRSDYDYDDVKRAICDVCKTIISHFD